MKEEIVLRTKKVNDLVVWDESFASGIELIDRQHKELINLTNLLYHACISGEKELQTAFKATMGNLVDYVRLHFGAELFILQQIGYPDYEDHKKRHDELVKLILKAVNEYNMGKSGIPNRFVFTLKDWIFGHIAVDDKAYAFFVTSQKRKGLLSDAQIQAITNNLTSAMEKR